VNGQRIIITYVIISNPAYQATATTKQEPQQIPSPDCHQLLTKYYKAYQHGAQNMGESVLTHLENFARKANCIAYIQIRICTVVTIR
jgi:hypothetical protein